MSCVNWYFYVSKYFLTLTVVDAELSGLANTIIAELPISLLGECIIIKTVLTSDELTRIWICKTYCNMIYCKIFLQKSYFYFVKKYTYSSWYLDFYPNFTIKKISWQIMIVTFILFYYMQMIYLIIRDNIKKNSTRFCLGSDELWSMNAAHFFFILLKDFPPLIHLSGYVWTMSWKFYKSQLDLIKIEIRIANLRKKHLNQYLATLCIFFFLLPEIIMLSS